MVEFSHDDHVLVSFEFLCCGRESRVSNTSKSRNIAISQFRNSIPHFAILLNKANAPCPLSNPPKSKSQHPRLLISVPPRKPYWSLPEFAFPPRGRTGFPEVNLRLPNTQRGAEGATVLVVASHSISQGQHHNNLEQACNQKHRQRL